MNFTEIVAEVTRLTERPDKLQDIRMAVNSAINFCCIEGNFSFDMEEQEVNISPTEYSQTILLTSLTRFRKIVYIRPGNLSCYLKPLDSSKVFHQGKQACNVYYIAGSGIKINLAKQAETVKIGYMQYPPILTDVSPTFWLLDISPFMIIELAASYVFGMVGNKTEEEKLKASAFVKLTSAQRDYKYGTNYG